QRPDPPCRIPARRGKRPVQPPTAFPQEATRRHVPPDSTADAHDTVEVPVLEHPFDRGPDVLDLEVESVVPVDDGPLRQLRLGVLGERDIPVRMRPPNIPLLAGGP